MGPGRNTVFGGITVWLIVAIGVGLTGVFTNASPPAIAITVWGLTGLVLIGWWKLPIMNRFLRDVDLWWLIALHLTRFVGIYFLMLCSRSELACAFARPAGIGDTCTAAGAAVLIATRRAAAGKPWRIGAVIWNIFGLLDIVLVVFTALRVGLSDFNEMAPLRTLPLMLLPTFLVPLIISSHIVIFVRLRRR